MYDTVTSFTAGMQGISVSTYTTWYVLKRGRRYSQLGSSVLWVVMGLVPDTLILSYGFEIGIVAAGLIDELI